MPHTACITLRDDGKDALTEDKGLGRLIVTNGRPKNGFHDFGLRKNHVKRLSRTSGYEM